MKRCDKEEVLLLLFPVLRRVDFNTVLKQRKNFQIQLFRVSKFGSVGKLDTSEKYSVKNVFI
jgi:hypothetical protein